MPWFDTPVEETVFYKEVKQEGREEKAQEALALFIQSFEGLQKQNLITQQQYEQALTAFKAGLQN